MIFDSQLHDGHQLENELTYNANKMFREQHPRPAHIRKCEQQLSVALSYSDRLHGKLQQATKLKFQAVMLFPQFDFPGPSLSWKI